jgi:hypothetical protein
MLHYRHPKLILAEQLIEEYLVPKSPDKDPKRGHHKLNNIPLQTSERNQIELRGTFGEDQIVMRNE